MRTLKIEKAIHRAVEATGCEGELEMVIQTNIGGNREVLGWACKGCGALSLIEDEKREA